MVAHVFGLVKSFYPNAEIEPLVEGMAEDCLEEKFSKYLKDVELVAHQIVDDMDLGSSVAV